MRFIIAILSCFVLCSCNSVYLKPNTLDKDATVYTPRGGYSMKRSVKQVMEKRGYKINVGSLQKVKESDIDETEVYTIPQNVRYSVRVTERKEILRPIWCMFNGFWWWNFSMSIIDKQTKEEILSWRGRGCANSSIHKLEHILDELEMKEPTKKTRQQKSSTTPLLILAKPAS
jgi:hypothetical protein